MTLDEAIKHHALDGDVQVAEWLMRLKQVLEGAYDQTEEVRSLKGKVARLQRRLDDETLLNNQLAKRVRELEEKAMRGGTVS